MNTVHCVKCKVAYQDKDPDDYYCPSCLEEHKKIIKAVQAKQRPPKKVMSDLQLHDASPNIRGFVITKL